jgi:hypothetical protein
MIELRSGPAAWSGDLLLPDIVQAAIGSITRPSKT